MEGVTKKAYLITGGSGGIGSELCKKIFDKGVIPIITYKDNRKVAETLAKELDGFSIHLDLSKEESIKLCIKELQDLLGTNTTLLGAVLCASPPPELNQITQLNSVSFTNQFNINVVGHHIFISLLIKKIFKKNKAGKVLGILTDAYDKKNKMHASGMSSYIVGKSAFETLLEIFSVEYKWLDILTINPSFTQTNMLKVFDDRYIEMIKKRSGIEDPNKIAMEIILKLSL
jgi:NAD(P)-dependent dehydrogenase (short-subunit alcohol dehydrogenase family)